MRNLREPQGHARHLFWTQRTTIEYNIADMFTHGGKSPNIGLLHIPREYNIADKFAH